jgi:hypothetical protein
VAIWATNESCVRDLKTFRAMPWSSKLMDVSFIVFPLGLTWIAYLYRTDGQDDARFWSWLAGFCWLVLFKVILTYVRGHYAGRQGVPPAPSGQRPNLEFMKWFTIFLGIAAVLIILLPWLLPIHHTVNHPRERWANDFLLVSLFFTNLSMYTRSRYWDIELD